MGFKYEIEINAIITKEDRGYWSKTPLNEFLAKCDDVSLLRVAIKSGDGGDTWTQIPAKIKIKRVIVDIE